MNTNKTFAITLALAAGVIGSGADLVTDEATRLKVLAAVFPGAFITATPAHIDNSGHSTFGPAEFDVIDPLGKELVYRITGAPRTENERCASEDVVSGTRSNVREARSRVYRIADSQFIAVSQYNFPSVGPAGACWSIARISLVEVRNQTLGESDSFEPNTTHHGGLHRLEFVSLSPGTPERLLIESDIGGGGGFEVSFLILAFDKGKLAPVLDTPSVFSHWGEKVNVYVQMFDVARTRAASGLRFCFTKTTYIEDDKHFTPPHITHPCYEPGEGVDHQR
jgi:hypothetical protein